jgi:predicted nucleic acid-binding protein
MRVTSNTSPIIALAKIGRLKLLKELYQKVMISPFVKVESVDKGKELGAPDALIIEKAIQEGWVKIVKLTQKQNLRAQKLVRETRIGPGEASALVLAKDKGLITILDDKEARAIAKSWGLKYMERLWYYMKLSSEN